WEELQEQGRLITAEELCRDCPDLLDEVKRRIRGLQAQEALRDTPTWRGTPLPLPVPLPAAPPPPTPPPGLRYRSVRFHARGGLGEVHLAEDTELHREVALKRVQERHLGNADLQRRFLREAEITARLQHPGIVPVYGLVVDEGGTACYAMRFIEGQSLQQALEDFHAAERSRRNSVEQRLALRELLSRFVTICNTM